MRCGVCDRDNPVDAAFCNGCGSRLTTGTSTAAPAAGYPESFAGGRYLVLGFLGEGGRKRVFRARDTRLDRDVALAVIKPEGLDAAARERVTREALSMARLGDHPNIVTVYDIGDEAGDAFLVCQYMPGGSLADILDGAEGHRLPVDRVIEIAEDVLRALEHAHSGGVVHRDLKPANVWMTASGTAKLGDFGLAIALEQARLTSEGMMLGTAAYLAPEQAVGGTVDGRADLYALGCVLYEALTGRPPFVGDDAFSVISQHLNTAPLPPSWHSPGVTPSLDAFVVSLLAKVPEDRPESASAALDGLARAVVDSEPPSPQPDAPAGAQVTRFVGREEELAQIRESIDRAMAGSGSLVLVVGEPGIGKTRLAYQAGEHARMRGMQVLVGRCYEAEAALPYIPFVEAIREIVTDRPADALRSELGDGAPDVAKLVSDIRHRLPDLPQPTSAEPEQERYRLFESVTTFLISASRSTPLMIVLDDLHWADRPSLLLMQHLARRLAGSRLILVGTYRDIELDRRHPLSEVLATLRRERLYERILLRGLAVEDVKEMLESAAQHRLGTGGTLLARALQRETEGNPFFIEETIRHLVEVGVIYQRDGLWRYDGRPDEMGIPEGIREVIGRRLSRLSETCNTALAHAAVLGRNFDFAELREMAGIDDDTLVSAVEEALAAQLVVEAKTRGGAMYSFSHALVRQTLYDELSLPRKQRLHLKAGQAIEAVHERNLIPHIASLAVHYRLAGAAAEEGRALGYSLQAGIAAAEVLAWEEAAAHLEAALELMDETGAADDSRAFLLERLGDLMYISGLDERKGIAYLERALALYAAIGNTDRAARTHIRLGMHRSTFEPTRDIPRALDHFRTAEAMIDASNETITHGYMHLGIAGAAVWGMRTEEGLEASRRAMDIAERLGYETLFANAAPLHAIHLHCAGRFAEAFEVVERAWQLADRLDHPFAAFSSTWNGAGVRLNSSDFPEGKRWIEREMAKPRMAQAPAQQETLKWMLSFAEQWLGNLAEARRLDAEIPNSPNMSLSYFNGNFDETIETGLYWEERSRKTGNLWTAFNAILWPALAHRSAGRRDVAVEMLEHALEMPPGVHIPFEMITRTYLVLMLVEGKRIHDAESHHARVEELLASIDDARGLTAVAMQSRALLAWGHGDVGAAEGHFREAVAELEAYENRASLALTLQLWGTMLLEAEDRARAIEKLDEALTLCRRMDLGKPFIDALLELKMRAQGIAGADAGSSIDRVMASVEGERPALWPEDSDGALAILFTDIESSTELNERFGDRRWLDVLRRHNAIVRECVGKYGGYEVKSQGDGFMVTFDDPQRAVQAAIAIQREMSAHNDHHPDEAVRVRIGLHAGEAIREAGDVFGRNVALAARVAAEATGGQILMTSAVEEFAGSDLDVGPAREVELKGLAGSHRLHEVAWAGV